MRYGDKVAARKAVWDTLQAKRVARFPFPPHGRIPNFAGARQAAERLLAHPLFKRVRVIKVNPDSPQRWVRQLALERGITVITPTPRAARDRLAAPSARSAGRDAGTRGTQES